MSRTLNVDAEHRMFLSVRRVSPAGLPALGARSQHHPITSFLAAMTTSMRGDDSTSTSLGNAPVTVGASLEPRGPGVAWCMIVSSIAGLGLWLYWPIFTVFWPENAFSDSWQNHPGVGRYGLIAVLAPLFLWLRRDLCPASVSQPHSTGLLFVGTSAALAGGALLLRIPVLAAGSILAWAVGIVCALGGYPWLKWAWPSILVLAFFVPVSIPLTYALSEPLQEAATTTACYLLQTLGYIAIHDGQSIVIDACQSDATSCQIDAAVYRVDAGTLETILLVGFGWLIAARRSLPEAVILLAGTLPIAVLLTATRIAAIAISAHPNITAAYETWLLGYSQWGLIPGAALLYVGGSAYFASVTYRLERVRVESLLPAGCPVGQVDTRATS